jgi:septal ring factor EnvC (AmiA/AmiB activator)
MQSLEDELELKAQRIKRLEQDVSMLQDSLLATQESVKETQRYLIKLAHSQMELNKRMTAWPFLKVKAKGKEDV